MSSQDASGESSPENGNGVIDSRRNSWIRSAFTLGPSVDESYGQNTPDPPSSYGSPAPLSDASGDHAPSPSVDIARLSRPPVVDLLGSIPHHEQRRLQAPLMPNGHSHGEYRDRFRSRSIDPPGRDRSRSRSIGPSARDRSRSRSIGPPGRDRSRSPSLPRFSDRSSSHFHDRSAPRDSARLSSPPIEDLLGSLSLDEQRGLPEALLPNGHNPPGRDLPGSQSLSPDQAAPGDSSAHHTGNE